MDKSRSKIEWTFYFLSISLFLGLTLSRSRSFTHWKWIHPLYFLSWANPSIVHQNSQLRGIIYKIRSNLCLEAAAEVEARQETIVVQLLFSSSSKRHQFVGFLFAMCCFIVISMRWQLTNEKENKSSSTKHLGYRILWNTWHRKGLVISLGPVIASRTCLGWQLIHVVIETESEEVHTYLIMCSYLH